jgi:ankyrin repeat protein
MEKKLFCHRFWAWFDDTAAFKSDKIDVNQQDRYGRTPLQIAVRYGHDKVVTLLLQSSTIDVNLQDRNGGTPLHLAAEYWGK